MTTQRVALAVLLLALSFSGHSAEAEQALHPLTDKRAAPAFELYDLNNKLHKLADYRGKVVIVNFWATWCPPCRQEFPSMDKAYQELQKDGIVMLAIDVGEDGDTIFEFSADYPVTFPILMDMDASITRQYGVIGLPTTYLIDPQGQLIYQVIGTREWTEAGLLKAIRSITSQNTSRK
jgi:peroxiredoxin